MSMQLVRSATGDGELNLDVLGHGGDGGELGPDLTAYTTSLKVRHPPAQRPGAPARQARHRISRQRCAWVTPWGGGGHAALGC
jgi:hypothetical protein